MNGEVGAGPPEHAAAAGGDRGRVRAPAWGTPQSAPRATGHAGVGAGRRRRQAGRDAEARGRRPAPPG